MDLKFCTRLGYSKYQSLQILFFFSALFKNLDKFYILFTGKYAYTYYIF